MRTQSSLQRWDGGLIRWGWESGGVQCVGGFVATRALRLVRVRWWNSKSFAVKRRGARPGWGSLSSRNAMQSGPQQVRT